MWENTDSTGHAMHCTKGSGNSVGATFTAACTATDHTAYWGQGPIAGALPWTGSQCSLGTSGSATITPPSPAPGGWIYFVVVGQDSSHEGSYGKASNGGDRPQAASGTGACRKPQQLAGSCD